jgi:hypothetical protein
VAGFDPTPVAYVYAPDGKGSRPIAHIAGFTGILQVDGYAGCRALAKMLGVSLAFVSRSTPGPAQLWPLSPTDFSPGGRSTAPYFLTPNISA